MMSRLALKFSIKNKLSGKPEEFKGFKFQQNLQSEFTENDDIFKNKIFA